ncbi:hypothetical protein KEM55_001454, partial [Ascosphaera atra]
QQIPTVGEQGQKGDGGEQEQQQDQAGPSSAQKTTSTGVKNPLESTVETAQGNQRIEPQGATTQTFPNQEGVGDDGEHVANTQEREHADEEEEVEREE